MKLLIRLECKPLPQILIQMDTQSNDVQLQLETSAKNSFQLSHNRQEQAELLELEVMMRPA